MQEMPQHATGDDCHDRGAHLRTKQLIGGRRSGSGQCKSAAGPEDAGQNMQHQGHKQGDLQAVLSLLISDIDYT